MSSFLNEMARSLLELKGKDCSRTYSRQKRKERSQTDVPIENPSVKEIRSKKKNELDVSSVLKDRQETERRSKKKHELEDTAVCGPVVRKRNSKKKQDSGKKVAVAKTVDKKRKLSNVEDSDFETELLASKKSKVKDTEAGPSKKGTRKGKAVMKQDEVKVDKDFPSLKNRCTPVAMLAIIQGLNRIQKECVIEMGFGSLLKLKMMDVPSKLSYYVVDHFNPESLRVEFENGAVEVNSMSVHQMLGLPIGGNLLSDMEYINEEDEQSCIFELKNQFGNLNDVRMKQLKNELLVNNEADLKFRIDFLLLFINTFCESTSMGKLNFNPLYFIRKDTNIRDIDWCNYLLDCLIRTKNSYNPKKLSSFFYGPVVYLVLLYVDRVKIDGFEVTRRQPTICHWTSEIIRFREDLEQENGGFGYGEINQVYVQENMEISDEEEEIVSDEDSDDEEELIVEGYEILITNMFEKSSASFKKMVRTIYKACRKFPEVESFRNWKSKVCISSMDVSNTDRQDFEVPVPSQANEEENEDEEASEDEEENEDEGVKDRHNEDQNDKDEGDGHIIANEGVIGGEDERAGPTNEKEREVSESREKEKGDEVNEEDMTNLNSVVDNIVQSANVIDNNDNINLSQLWTDPIAEVGSLFKGSNDGAIVTSGIGSSVEQNKSVGEVEGHTSVETVLDFCGDVFIGSQAIESDKVDENKEKGNGSQDSILDKGDK